VNRPSDPRPGHGCQAPGDDRVLVLYIEDDSANVKLVEHILRRTPGAELISASHGQRGLQLARTERPDMILLDLHLPDMTGEEIAASLQGDPETRGIPIVVITGAADEATPARLREHGISDYLRKPFAIGDVSGAVERFGRADAGR
jgi:CheY-like chemotaxis protein